MKSAGQHEAQQSSLYYHGPGDWGQGTLGTFWRADPEIKYVNNGSQMSGIRSVSAFLAPHHCTFFQTHFVFSQEEI